MRPSSEGAEAFATARMGASLPNGWQPDADTHRYLALAHLLSGQVADAATAIERAMKTGSKQPPVREAYAQILYFSAISPAFAHAFRHLLWPVPVPWSFVKRGRVELNKLKHAAEIFATLAGESTVRDDDRIRHYRWQVGALGCHLEEQATAAAVARARLVTAPDDSAVVVWALERGYEFDRARSAESLLQKLKTGGTIEDCLALCTLFVFGDELNRAQALLDEYRTLFNAIGGDAAWQAQKDDITRLGAEQADRHLAPNAKERANELLARYEMSPDPRGLFELCEAQARIQKWDFIADHANELLSGVGTEAALRVAVQGLFRAGRYAECLETLETNTHLLPDNSLSTDMLELRIECRRRLGHVSKALDEAEKAFAVTRSFRQLLHLFQTQLGASDTTGAAHSARLALKLPHVPAEFFIEAARIIRAFDRELAIELWRRGVSSGVPSPQHVQLAYETAIGLGLDREAAPLAQRMFLLAQEGTGRDEELKDYAVGAAPKLL